MNIIDFTAIIINEGFRRMKVKYSAPVIESLYEYLKETERFKESVGDVSFPQALSVVKGYNPYSEYRCNYTIEFSYEDIPNSSKTLKDGSPISDLPYSLRVINVEDCDCEGEHKVPCSQFISERSVIFHQSNEEIAYFI